MIIIFVAILLWTIFIKKTIDKFKPDYIIVNSGGALIKGYENSPIVMDEMQTMAFVSNSDNAKVIAVKMDALDYCRTTRSSLSKKAAEFKIGTDKLLIPKDGEIINLSL